MFKQGLKGEEEIFPLEFIIAKSTILFLQEKLVLKDFNIEAEAGGDEIPIIKNFTAAVTSHTLKIHFYWAGKGTTGIPLRGVYGPLISAISVEPSKSNCIFVKCIIILLFLFGSFLNIIKNA